jgi:galactokinase
MASDLHTQATQLFAHAYGTTPNIIASAPGRVNIIGEHTDYNDGFVMPMAIERETFVVGKAREGLSQPTYRFVSANASGDGHSQPNQHTTPTVTEFDSNALYSTATPNVWHSYVRGVIAQYAKDGHNIPSFDIAIVGNVPLGGGLSSSASLEVATATFLDALLNLPTDKIKKALKCQRAEHEYANVPCGIMDQFISSCGEPSAAMLLDCRSQEYKLVPIVDKSVAILITNSNVKHALGSGEYAIRRAQCEEAVRAISAKYPAVRSLRDATLDQLFTVSEVIPAVVFSRAMHVITEIERCIKAAEALASNDYVKCGQLMTHSHVSLKNEYEVSCDELDALVDIALSQHGVYGSRMTGGGFGGCTVSLVEAARVDEIIKSIKAEYPKRCPGKEATCMVSIPSAGARLHQL